MLAFRMGQCEERTTFRKFTFARAHHVPLLGRPRSPFISSIKASATTSSFNAQQTTSSSCNRLLYNEQCCSSGIVIDDACYPATQDFPQGILVGTSGTSRYVLSSPSTGFISTGSYNTNQDGDTYIVQGHDYGGKDGGNGADGANGADGGITINQGYTFSNGGGGYTYSAPDIGGFTMSIGDNDQVGASIRSSVSAHLSSVFASQSALFGGSSTTSSSSSTARPTSTSSSASALNLGGSNGAVSGMAIGGIQASFALAIAAGVGAVML